MDRQVISITPLRRSQEEIRYSDGGREIRCYSPANPHYYQDEAGRLNPIDLLDMQDSTSKIGKVFLRSKNVASVGVRQNGQPFKAVGVRPDFSQAKGDHQLEFTLSRVVVDGSEQGIAGYIAPPVMSEKSPLIMDMNRFQVIAGRQGCRQAVLIDGPVSSFRIEFQIHTKGLTVFPAGIAGRDVYRISDDQGLVDWMIGEPLVMDADFNVMEDGFGLISHSLEDNGDGIYTYIKESAPGADLSILPGQFWVDVNTVYGMTADGFVRNTYSTWSSCRTGSSGSRTFSSTGNSSIYGAGTTTGFSIWRVFLYFDTSGLSGSVLSASVGIRGYSYGDSWVYLQQGTQADTLSTDDYTAYSGLQFSIDSAWGTSGYNVLALNATGIAAVVLGGTAKYCLREKQDYNNVTPTASGYNGLYFTDNTGTTYDPYLSLEIETTHTGAVSIDALISRAGVTGTSSLDALIAKSGVTRTASLNALIQKSGVSRTASLDAQLQTSFPAASSIDALAQRSGVSAAALADALLEKAGVIAGSSLDGLLKTAFAVGVSPDALLAKAITATTGMDALLVPSSGQIAAALDALLSGLFDISLQADAILQAASSAATGTDALIQSAKAAPAGLDASLSQGKSQPFSLDAALQDTLTATASIDAQIRLGGGLTAAMDALLTEAVSAIVGMDAALTQAGNAQALLDGCLQAMAAASLQADACLYARNTSSSGISSMLQSSGVVSTQADALISTINNSAVSLDSLFFSEIFLTVALDAAYTWTDTAGVSLTAFILNPDQIPPVRDHIDAAAQVKGIDAGLPVKGVDADLPVRGIDADIITKAIDAETLN